MAPTDCFFFLLQWTCSKRHLGKISKMSPWCQGHKPSPHDNYMVFPQQNPRFSICHCTSVIFRCSDKVNNILLSVLLLKLQKASKAEGNMLHWSCEQSNLCFLSITDANPLWLPMESAVMLPEVLAVKICTLWTEGISLNARKKKSSKIAKVILNPSACLWIQVHRKFPIDVGSVQKAALELQNIAGKLLKNEKLEPVLSALSQMKLSFLLEKETILK